MKNATTITLLCLAAALLIPGIAAADVMTSNGTGMGDTIHYRMDGSYWKNSFGGQLFITYQNTDYTTYCVELTQPLGTGQVTEVPAEDVLNNSGAIHMLYEMYNDQVSSNVEAAALQVAIWELLYEDGTDFDAASGDFRAWTVDYDIITTANSLLALVPDPTFFPENELIVLSSPCRQDVIISGPPVPEPGTMAMLALGGVALLRRKFRRVV